MSSIAMFQRRLAEANRARELPASARFDLAASTIDDDALEQTVSLFGGPEPDQRGFGMSDILQEVLSRDPKSIPVTSLQQTQQSLVRMGYADPAVPQNGEWSPYWNSAFRRSDRDAYEQVRGGKGVFSATTEDFFRYLGYTVPTEVIKAVFGMAQGIVEQVADVARNPAEAVEEAGLAGGAAVGAIAGGTIGSVIPGAGTLAGAGIGAVVGGAAGFFGDLFDIGGETEDPEGTRAIWDALTPYDEYKETGADHFFNLLSTVMTASGVLKSISVAKGLGQAAVSAPRVSVRQAFGTATPSPTPGLINKTFQNALNGKMRSGATIGAVANSFDEIIQGDFEGAFGEALKGAAIGAVGAKAAGAFVPKGLKDFALNARFGLRNAPLRRIQSSTAGQLTQAGYTGLSGSAISGRLFGGIGPGETAIQREIAEAEEVDFGPLGTAVDVTLGMAIFPERLLPWRARDVAGAFRELATGHAMLPFTRAVQARNPGMSFRQAWSKTEQMLGATERGGYSRTKHALRIQRIMLNRQIGVEADAVVSGRGLDDIAARDDALIEAKSEIIGRIYEEAGSRDLQKILRTSPTGQRLFQDALHDPVGMENAILGWDDAASGLEHVLEHDRAEGFLQTASRTITDRQGKRVTIIPAVKDKYVTMQDYDGFADTYLETSTAYRDAFNAAADAPVGSPLVKARTNAGAALDRTLTDMRDRGVITPRQYEDLHPAGTVIRPEPLVDKELVAELKRIAKDRPPEIPEFTAQLKDKGLGRYKAVATGENMIFYDHLDSLLGSLHIDEYTRFDRFHDTLASFTRKIDDLDQLGTARFVEIQKELDLAASELRGRGWKAARTGKQITNDLYDGWRKRYDPLMQAQEGVSVTPVAGAFIKRMEAGQVKFELFKVDPRDLTATDIVDILPYLDEIPGMDPLDAARRIKRGIHDGASFGATAERAVQNPIQQARVLMRSMRLQGLPGASEFARTLHFPERGARVARKFKVGKQLIDQTNAFWLPHSLHRVNMALRFGINPGYDISRYMEQGVLGFYQGVPVRVAMRPAKFIMDEKMEWQSLDGMGTVKGQEALQQAYRLADEGLYHRRVWAGFDEMQFRNFNRGAVMFAPRQVEAASFWWFAQQELKAGRSLKPQKLDEIRERVLQISRYGSGPSAAERSMHFVLFPFLFQAKLVRHLHDFVLAAPARNLLVHEGLRRWNTIIEDKTVGQRFSEFVEKHVPFAAELSRLNNYAYGISPGRFFLEGLADKDSAGKVAQIATQFLLPGGVHQPLTSLAGAFAPVVVNENQDIEGIIQQAVPMWRDIDRFFASEGDRPGIFTQQVKALPEFIPGGEGAAPYAQLQDYAETKNEQKIEMLAPLEPALIEAGYSGIDGFLRSDAGRPIAQMLDQRDLENGERNPTGKLLYNQFENSAEIKQQKLFSLIQKDDLSAAEEAITTLGSIEELAKSFAVQNGISQEDAFRGLAPMFRQFALQHSQDRQFAALWDQLFAFDYGPLTRIVAA